MRTLVLGYGNTTRCDDGAGIRIAQEIEKEKLPDVDVMTYQQLHVDLVSEFAYYNRIILVDTSVDGEEMSLRKLRPSSQNYMASSHHLGPELILRLAQITQLGEPEMHLCTVRGKCFDYGEELSEEAQARTRAAVQEIKFLILGEKVPDA